MNFKSESTDIGEYQSDLSPIWGKSWNPEKHLEFVKVVETEEIKNRFLSFVAERHDGYLGEIADCWLKVEFPEKLNGEKFHEYSKKILDEIVTNLTNRTIEPKLSKEWTEKRGKK